MKSPSSKAEQTVGRIWRMVFRPEVAAGLVFAAALVTVLAPLSELPSRVPQSWWSTPFHFSEVLRASATLLGMAALVWFGSELDLYRRKKNSNRERLKLLGRLLALVGVSLGTGVWLYGQSALPTSVLMLPPGQNTENMPAKDVRGAVRVMLPYRLKVATLDDKQGSASIQISGVNEPGNIYDLRVGSPLDVGGYRIALIGIRYDERVLRATLEGTTEDSIGAMGSIGSIVRFQLDGPEYEVTQISRNYLQAMGPAVELRQGEEERFWVFQRATATQIEPSAPIRLLGLETAPLAVLAITQSRYGEVGVAGGIIFLLGLLLLMFVRREEE